MRTKKEILEAEDKYFHAVWLERHEREKLQEELEEYYLSDNAEKRKIAIDAFTLAEKVHNKYKDDFEFNLYSLNYDPEEKAYWTGFINGKLSALRWVMGGDWDQLDT